MNGMTADTLALLPELCLLVGAIGCLLLGSWTPRGRQRRVAVAAGVAVAASLLATGAGPAGITAQTRSAFSGTFAVDAATDVLRLVVGLSLAVLLILARAEIRGHARESEVYVMLLLGALGVILVGGATDLAVLVVGFLLASIPLYGLIGLSAGSSAPEAAVKTYLFGALSGILMMLGAAVLYGLGGGTSYEALSRLEEVSPAAAVAGVVLLLLGLLFKAGAVPAHPWVPDAVEGSWTVTGAFLTTVPKLGAVLAIARLLETLPGDRTWPLLVGAIAAASMTVGNLAALGQRYVRRLLAWSTISQVGYLLAAAAAVTGSDDALPALLLFLAAYAVTNLGCFAVLAAEPERRAIADWRGAGRSRPVLTGALGVSLLGLVGTPPTAVFVAKLLTIAVTWEAELRWLAVLIAVNTVLSLAYYLRWLAVCLGTGTPPQEDGAQEDRPAGDDIEQPAARRVAGRLAVSCAAAAVVLGLVAGPALTLTR